MNYQPFSSRSLIRGFMQSLLCCILLVVFCVTFVALLFFEIQLNKELDSNQSTISALARHQQQIAQLKENFSHYLDGDNKATPIEEVAAANALASGQWLQALNILDNTIASDSKLPNFLALSVDVNTTTTPENTRELKILLNEISLVVAQLQGEQKNLSSLNTYQNAIQAARTQLGDYQKLSEPLINKRIKTLDTLNDRISFYRMVGKATQFSLIIAFLLLNFYLLALLAQARRQYRLQSELVSASVSHTKYGLLLTDMNLIVEYSDLEGLQIQLPVFLAEHNTIHTLFAEQLEQTELQSWSIALKNLRYTTHGDSLHGDTLTRTITLETEHGNQEFEFVSSCIGNKKSRKILTTLKPLLPAQQIQSTHFSDDLKQLDDQSALNKQNTQQQNEANKNTDKPTHHIRLKKDFSRRLKLIETLIQMDPSIAAEFFNDTKKALQTCQMRMKALEKGQHNPNTMLSGLLQALHQIKGDSAILGLMDLSQSIHHLEDNLNELSHPPTANRSKLSIASERFEQMRRQFDNLYRLFFRFSKKDQQINDGEQQNFSTYLSQYAQKIARDANKRVKVVEDNIKSLEIPEGKLSQVMTLLSQLIRNAIAHGLEDQATRQSLHKTDYGCLHIAAEQTATCLKIKVRDDGRGIEIPKVLAKAKKLGTFDPDNGKKMTSEILFNILATPGLTTQSQADQHAGRGMGLELVKTITKSLNGNVILNTKPGQFTEFVITLPLQDKSQHSEDDIPVLAMEARELTIV